MPPEVQVVPYLLLLSLMLVICRVVVRHVDTTDTLAAPIPDHINPYEVAYLRGGKEEVDRLAILDLVSTVHLDILRLTPPVTTAHNLLTVSRSKRLALIKASEGQGLPWYLSSALRRFATSTDVEAVNTLWDGEEWSQLRAQLEGPLRTATLLPTGEIQAARLIAMVVSFVLHILLILIAAPTLLEIFGSHVPAFVIFSIGGFGLLVACDIGGRTKRAQSYIVHLQSAYRRPSGPEYEPSPRSYVWGHTWGRRAGLCLSQLRLANRHTPALAQLPLQAESRAEPALLISFAIFGSAGVVTSYKFVDHMFALRPSEEF